MKSKVGLWVLKYLRFWARLQLKKTTPDIIGITGSAGKTSCRNAVKAVLQDKYSVKISTKANSESGIPLNILGITPHDYSPLDWLWMCLLAPIKFLTNWQVFEKYVVEMGIDSPEPPKNMAYLLTIIQPRTAVFLNALPVHTAFFTGKDPINAIAQEKGKLIESLPESGLAILNADDPRVAVLAKKTQAQVMTFGKKGQVKITGWKTNLKGTEYDFAHADQQATLKLPFVLPAHFGYSFAAALAIGLDEDYTLAESAALLTKHFHLPPGRSSVFVGINDSTIIDSTYNASPQTIKDMLVLLQAIPGKRKLALLGDMRELGAEADRVHEQVIQQALSACDAVYLVGPLMRQNMTAGAVWCETARQAAQVIKPQLRSGDVLLVKGSQNTLFLETAVEKLLANKTDEAKLCRRGKYWGKRKFN